MLLYALSSPFCIFCNSENEKWEVPDGSFEAAQCDTAENTTWCINKDGAILVKTVGTYILFAYLLNPLELSVTCMNIQPFNVFTRIGVILFPYLVALYKSIFILKPKSLL